MDWNMLNGTQIWVLSEAIMHAFPDPALFDTFLLTKLNKDPMRNFVAPGGYSVILPAYLQFVRGDGWVDKLVAKLQGEKPNNPLIRNLARAVRLAGAEPPDRLGPEIELEAIASGGGFSDARAWLRTMAEISEATCRIESPAGNALGTGILVAPDYVLTNYHVAKLWTDDATAVCRFGYARNTTGTDTGELKALAPGNAKAASSVDDSVAALSKPNGPVLDYALLKLASSITSIVPIPVRPGRNALINTPALIVQHPSGEPQRLALGKFLATTGERWQYDADTMRGSSGSGVFNQKLELVALHHAGHSGSDFNFTYNQGIAIDAIIGSLRQTLVPRFW
ncbi:trypsin-like peptidase domain-containing protein [Rhizobium leguminosarum]|uniref:trypsin-like peptidase domain-containing protein n=1 Tax=Rhizobium TaxID=379 RepID=UPI00140F81FF|nr:trypsin-like peptidase domain-containing protein [Rhizobium leguminosarum]MBY5917731.1 trypsin-like peptidase domain-containing protein [Rhizobium leguminosarum]QIO66041.1 trypsin-like peptidase domain-containing protein [Rhizobium leguminosarum bv. trifolii]